jgi:6-phosphogluconolactonase
MSFRRAARAALTGVPLVLAVLMLAAFSVSCVGGGTHRTRVDPNHSAYVTLPQTGAVLQLHIDGTTGTITLGAQTPQVLSSTPTGIAILPSKKFLYAANSFANTISIYSVASDGSLNLTGTPVPAGGSSPNLAVIDPSGKYLLVTNNLSDNVSVFSIDASSGALTPTAGSPFPANANPAEIIITPAGDAVYVTNPGIGMVTAFSFANGVLTQLPTSPVFSGRGASGLAIDATGRFLYVANPLAINPPPIASIGNISGFNINPDTGELTPILGSPFTSATGTGPTALAIDPGGRFVYATTTGSSFAIWCFAITPSNGQLVPVTGSPFSVAGGSLFALFDPSGNFFYIGSQSGNGIEGYTYNPNNGTLTAIPGTPFSTGTPPGKMALSD